MAPDSPLDTQFLQLKHWFKDLFSVLTRQEKVLRALWLPPPIRFIAATFSTLNRSNDSICAANESIFCALSAHQLKDWQYPLPHEHLQARTLPRTSQ